ncbi:hypothetical protein Sp245p_28915 (plasmid) [Azospirillum baldaniorum]|uniref:Uncharacterized protein n=1 Tax=Azospirillum baldaniorum TaxID=1064539 RepID=A0A9P1JY75_9PROT|nr:phage tail tube protein [Azospirillum baldaniorum]AWJ93844.1 hypothetical protein Sp245p_28915 [Azospirillum baldaniorum]TWA81668.1 hypothetical protein FBZ85_10242 [Azospirillum brasilense]CCD02004.1 conserved protein of unknown function [Azospirillum baldaniorum]
MVTIADAASGQLRYAEEVTRGVTPAVAFKNLRLTQESLDEGYETVVSQEISADGNIIDTIPVRAGSQGSVEGELSIGTYDDFMESALQGDWSAAINRTGTDLSITASSKTLTAGSTSFSGIAAGDWVKLSGFATAANNGIFHVASATANTLGFDRALEGTLALVDEAAGASVSIRMQKLTNARTRHFYSIEKEFSDIGQFRVFRGMEVDTMALTFNVGEVLTTQFGFIGMSSDAGTTTFGTGAHIGSSTAPVLSPVANTGPFAIDGAPYQNGILSMTLNVSNGLRAQESIGSLYPVGVGRDRVNVSGQMEFYFADNTIYSKFKTRTPMSVTFYVTEGVAADGTADPSLGSTYVFELPKVKVTSNPTNLEGLGNDVISQCDVQALKSDFGYTMAVFKF